VNPELLLGRREKIPLDRSRVPARIAFRNRFRAIIAFCPNARAHTNQRAMVESFNAVSAATAEIT
jgi:hypothetical protein